MRYPSPNINRITSLLFRKFVSQLFAKKFAMTDYDPYNDFWEDFLTGVVVAIITMRISNKTKDENDNNENDSTENGSNNNRKLIAIDFIFMNSMEFFMDLVLKVLKVREVMEGSWKDWEIVQNWKLSFNNPNMN